MFELIAFLFNRPYLIEYLTHSPLISVNMVSLKVECMVEVPPEIEVAGNASSFAVFATVRLAVLERWMKEVCEHFHILSSTGEDSEDDTAQAQAVIPLPPIPKVIIIFRYTFIQCLLIKNNYKSHNFFA